jgi:hypothetical protein
MPANSRADGSDAVKQDRFFLIQNVTVGTWSIADRQDDTLSMGVKQACDLLNEQAETIDRSFRSLELCGVPRGRAGSVANGIAVLTTRFGREVRVLRAENTTLWRVVRWVMGMEGEFPARVEGDPAYWFRSALRAEFPQIVPQLDNWQPLPGGEPDPVTPVMEQLGGDRAIYRCRNCGNAVIDKPGETKICPMCAPEASGP